MIKTLRDALGLLATRRFGTFWFSSLLSSIGTWAQQVAEPWLLLSLGASPFLIGLDSFAMNGPVLLLTLVGGALADRSSRRLVIGLFQSIQLLCPTAVVVLLLTGLIRPWTIIALSVVVGVTDALSMPSFQSIVPSLVSRDQLGRALALNATQFQLSRILGPSLAGVLLVSLGAVACFAISAASYVPFIGVALWILPRRSPGLPREPAPSWRLLLAGHREVLRQPPLRSALLTVLVGSLLCAPLITFVPVLVTEAFRGGAGHFSMAVASFGVGGLVGAIGLLALPRGVEPRRLTSGFALANGAVLVLTALDPWFWGLAPLLAMAGASMTISNTAANSILQASAGPHLLGRTVSLYMLAMRGGIALGALLVGAVIGEMGVRPTLLACGLAAVVIQAVLARTWRREAA